MSFMQPPPGTHGYINGPPPQPPNGQNFQPNQFPGGHPSMGPPGSFSGPPGPPQMNGPPSTYSPGPPSHEFGTMKIVNAPPGPPPSLPFNSANSAFKPANPPDASSRNGFDHGPPPPNNAPPPAFSQANQGPPSVLSNNSPAPQLQYPDPQSSQRPGSQQGQQHSSQLQPQEHSQSPKPGAQGPPPSFQGPPSMPGQPLNMRGDMSPGPGQMSVRHPMQGVPSQPPMPGMPGQPSIPGMPPSSMPSQLPMPGMSGQPPRPGMHGQPPSSMPGQPPMPGMPGQPPMPGMPGQPPMPGMPGQPPMPGMPGQPPRPAQPPMPGMPPSSMPGQPPMPGMPGQPSMQSMAGQPPMPGMPGQPPRPGQPPMPGMPPSSMPGQPPMPGMPGQPPMPGMPGQPSMQSMAGQPPMPGQPPRPGQPPMPGMPPSSMPGQPPMPGMSGQPPIPGQPPNAMAGYPGGPRPMTGPPGFGAPPAAPPAQASSLNPDAMPSPITVIVNDQLERAGQFSYTVGQLPPLVTTDYAYNDTTANVSPRVMRATTYVLQATADMVKTSKLPMGLVIQPLAEPGPGERPVVPIIDPRTNTEGGPVIRCRRCRAYMCPMNAFIDGGKSFTCCFCQVTTEVPQEYFSYLDHMGFRYDRGDRPELSCGSYEWTVGTEYCRQQKPPKEPALIFMIDVSYNSMRNGLLSLLASNLKRVVTECLPRDSDQARSEMRVGFVAYARSLHFFGLRKQEPSTAAASSATQNGEAGEPTPSEPASKSKKGSLVEMKIVTDLDDVFVPISNNFLMRPCDVEPAIDALLSELPNLYSIEASQQGGAPAETEIMLGPAVEAGLDALKSTGRSGRLILFHTSLPNMEAPGKLKNREDKSILGTDKEASLFAPASDNYYSKLAERCVRDACSVDLFLCPTASFIDIATLSVLTKCTGGSIYRYPYFQPPHHAAQLLADLRRSVSRQQGFDAILRVRTSAGIRPVDFHGNFLMDNATDVELATIDADKAISLEIKHDDKLEGNAFVQAALLYTSPGGRRRLRVHNLTLQTSASFPDVFRSVELDTLINMMSKQACGTMLTDSTKAIRTNVTTQCAHILTSYRKHCATQSPITQLILPECLKIFPLYANCLVKSDAFNSASDMSIDERAFWIACIGSMGVKESQAFFYPRLFPVLLNGAPAGTEAESLVGADDDSLPADFQLPRSVRVSLDKLNPKGVYCFDDGFSMILWIGSEVTQDQITDLLGGVTPQHISPHLNDLPKLDSAASRYTRHVIELVRRQRRKFLKIGIVLSRRQPDPTQAGFARKLVEDDHGRAGKSYVDYLCEVHREIRDLYS